MPARSRSAPAASWRSAPTRPTTSVCACRLNIFVVFAARRLCAAGGRHPVRPAAACASRASISRWPRWPRSSSSTGCSCASSGSPTTRPRARSLRRHRQVFGIGSRARRADYLFTLVFVTVLALVAKNLVRSASAAQWMAIRDMDVAAEVIGIRPMYAKLTAFAVSSFYLRRGRRAVGLRLPRRRGSRRPSLDRSFQPAVHGHHRRARLDPGLLPRRGLHRGAADLPDQVCRSALWPAASSTATVSHSSSMIFGALIVFFLSSSRTGLRAVVDRQGEAAPVALPALRCIAGTNR